MFSSQMGKQRQREAWYRGGEPGSASHSDPKSTRSHDIAESRDDNNRGDSSLTMHQALSLTTLQASPYLLLTIPRGGCNYVPTLQMTTLRRREVKFCARGTRPVRSASPGRAASGSGDSGKGPGHKGSGLGWGACRGPPLSQGDAPSGDTRAQDAGPGPPPSPPRGPREHSQPPPRGGRRGLLGLSRRARGAGRREVPGGCPAKPPPTAACPRRASCRAAGPRAGGKDAGQEARPPRLLPAPETRRTLCARDRPARATPAQGPPPPPEPPPSPLLPSIPLPAPPARKTGSVASALPDTGSVANSGPGTGSVAAPSLRPGFVGSRRPAGGLAASGALVSAVRGPLHVPGSAESPRREPRAEDKALSAVAAQETFESEDLGANRFCCCDSPLLFLMENPPLAHFF